MKRLAAVAVLACACTKPSPEPSRVDAGAVAPVQPTVASGKEIAQHACLSCHSEEMLVQQRLPKEKWAATVKKMVGWGAGVEPAETEPLVEWLAASYGPDAGPWEPKTITADSARAALEPKDDPALSGGDGGHGKQLFAERCASCHGPEARGMAGLGVNLVERTVIYRPGDVAATVRRGRGKMPPMPATTDREVADIVAHLRTLRVP